MLDTAFQSFFLLVILNITLSSCLICEDCPLPCDVPGVCTTKAKCFVRRDVNGLIYRGCADKERWKDLDISDNACSLQHYLGWNQTKALWCFCDSTLCNRRNINSFTNGPKMLADITRNETGVFNGHSSKNVTNQSMSVGSNAAKQLKLKAAEIDAKQGKDAANFRQQQLSLIFGIKLKEQNKIKNNIFGNGISRSQISLSNRQSAINSFIPYNKGTRDSRLQNTGTRNVPKNRNQMETKSNNKYSNPKQHLYGYNKYIPERRNEKLFNQNHSPQIYPVRKNENSQLLSGDENKKPSLVHNRNNMPEIYPLSNDKLELQNTIADDEILLEGSQPPPQGNRFDINLESPTPESILPANRTVMDILTPFITKHVFQNNNYIRTNFTGVSNDYQIERNANYLNDTFVVIDGIFERRLPQIWPTGFKKPLDAKESKPVIDKTLIRDKYIKEANMFSKDKVGPDGGIIVQPNRDNTILNVNNMKTTIATILTTMVDDDNVNGYHTEILASAHNKIRKTETSYLPSVTTSRSTTMSTSPTALTNTTFKYQLFLKQTTPVYTNFTQTVKLKTKHNLKEVEFINISRSSKDSSIKSKTDISETIIDTIDMQQNSKSDISENTVDFVDKKKNSKPRFSTSIVGDTGNYKQYKSKQEFYTGKTDGVYNQYNLETYNEDDYKTTTSSLHKQKIDSHDPTKQKKPNWKYNFSERVTVPVSSLSSVEADSLKVNYTVDNDQTKTDEFLNYKHINKTKDLISEKTDFRKLSIKITPLQHGQINEKNKFEFKHNIKSCGKILKQDNEKCPDNFIHVPKFKSCYMFSTSYHNYTTSQEFCQRGNDHGDLITIETHQEYRCISEWLQSLPGLMDGWQGWWTGGLYKQEISDFVWSHNGNVINKTNQDWQPSLVVHPYDNTCIWFVPLSGFSLGNYWCDEIGGFICETKAKL